MAAVGAGVLVLCLASSAGAYFFTQGGDEKPKKPSLGPSPLVGPSPPTTPTVPATPAVPAGPTALTDDATGYNKFANFSLTEGTIGECTTDSTVQNCGINCDYNPDCVGFTFTTNDNKCCLKTAVSGLNIAGSSDATFIKTLTDYDVKKLGNLVNGAISKESSDIETCMRSCDNNRDCIGFSYGDGECELKQGGSDLSTTYRIDGKQYFSRKYSGLPKARFVRLKLTGPSKYVITVREIKVLAPDGRNLALSRPVTSSDTHGTTFVNTNAVDGDTGSFWHSAHTSNDRYITVDLGSLQEIKRIEIFNVEGNTVYNGVKVIDRMSGGGPGSSDKGSFIELLDDSSNVTLTSADIKASQGKYVLDFSVSQLWF